MKTHPKRKVDPTSCYVFGLLCLLALLATCSTGCAAGRGLLYDRLPEILDPGGGKPDPADPADPVSRPWAAETEAMFRDMRWTKGNRAGAQVTRTLHSVTVKNQNSVDYRADSLEGWPSKTSSQGKVTHGEWSLAVYRNGRWEGGMADHTRADQRNRSMNNVRNGYTNIAFPKAGERVRFFITSYNGREATNFIEAVWP
jgi:hypothetical protein